MKLNQQNPHVLWVIDLSLILFNTSCKIYLIPKEWNYGAVFLAIDDGNKCVRLLFSLRFMAYAPSFILGKIPSNLVKTVNNN